MQNVKGELVGSDTKNIFKTSYLFTRFLLKYLANFEMYLNCHTYFSLQFGTFSPEGLVAEACDKGVEVLALTDINNTSAAFYFIKACKEAGIKPVIGIEFRNGDELLYIGLAKNNKGFKELNSYLSKYTLAKQLLPSSAPEFKNVYVIYPVGKKEVEELRPNEFIGIRISELNKLTFSDVHKDQDKLVMLHPVTFKDKAGFNTHRLLRAIDRNTLLSKLSPDSQASADEMMLPMDKLLGSYGRFPKIIHNTMELLSWCEIEFNSEPKNRKTFTGDPSDDKLLLEKLAMEGLKNRYGTRNKVAKERVVKELDIINRLGFNAYFLITWDILRYAISRNFPYVGRGSGANSIVAYCLKITEVDPIELDLYFERFLNPYRTSPPDFDVDFAWNDRDEVIDYIFKRYGLKHTALIATYNTFRGKSVIRELAKVFGLPKNEIDLLVSNPELLKDRDDIAKAIFRYGQKMMDFPNHLSIHAGGIVISEKPVHCFTATDMPPKGFPITHFDMWTAEDAGYYKFDILSQRGLGTIKDSIKLVQKNLGKTIEIDTDVCKKDKKVKEHIEAGNTIGCFYVESPGMRGLLKKLRCNDYLSLVAASSIIRPGVASSGMMQQYIFRFNNPDKIEYLHPIMEELLKETYGVMVYQEDVIKVAHYFGGIDLGEADMLRRAMSGKYRGKDEMMRIKDNFFASAAQKGHPEELIKEVWRQIESFSGYSFSKAHSASFAIESYHCLYLKAHFPLEFMVAVINNMGGFYSTEFYVHEARRNGGDIQAPCINNSEVQTSICGKIIYIGFQHVKSLENKLADALVTEREVNGPYKDLYDLIKRIPVSLEQLKILIRIGALRFTQKNKKELLLEACLTFSKSKVKVQGAELFETEREALKLPKLSNFSFEDAFDQIELLEFPLCFPFDLLPKEYKGDITASEMMSNIGKRVSMLGYFVCAKSHYTRNNEVMNFNHFLDTNGATFDTTHFPQSLKRYPMKGKGFYLLKGKIVNEFGHPSMEVESMVKLPMVKKEVI